MTSTLSGKLFLYQITGTTPTLYYANEYNGKFELSGGFDVRYFFNEARMTDETVNLVDKQNITKIDGVLLDLVPAISRIQTHPISIARASASEFSDAVLTAYISKDEFLPNYTD